MIRTYDASNKQMKILYLSVVIAVLSLMSPLVSAQNDSDLFPVVENGLVGYIDRTGTVRIAPQFINGWKFAEGLACVVSKNGLAGFINTKGEFVIKPQFDPLWGLCTDEFNDGVASVSKGFDYAPHAGPARKKGKRGFVDTIGVFRQAKGVEFLSDLKEGLAFFEKGGLTGYMDKNLEIVISPRFKSAGNFYFGRARAEDVDGKEYYLDKTGKKLFPNWDGGEFQDSRAFFKKDGKYGFIDLNGKIIIAAKFDDATHFGEGLAGVRVGEKWGFVNAKGEKVIEPRFDAVGVFSEGLVSVELNGKWGFIDRVGRMVIAPQFDKWTYYFENGLCNVHVGDLQGYIDKDGKFVWPLSK